MRNASVRFARLWWLQAAVVFGVVLGLVISPVSVQAQDPVPVKRVEEDWVLVLNDPSADNAAPQVTCVMSPVGHADGVFATLELNHGTLPEYRAGGLQLQVWNGEDWLTVRDHADTTLHQSGEVVTFTRKMWLNGGKLNFNVVNGNSSSWGAFGATDNIKLAIASSLSDLNGYSPDLSKSQSGIGYGSQRVQTLKLNKIRYYDGLGNLLQEDTTPRVVHQQ